MRPTVSVTSFNIRYGTADDGPDRWAFRKGGVTDFLKKRDSSIVCLQEALTFQLEEILKECPKYRLEGIGRDDGLREGEYAAILYDDKQFEKVASGSFWLSDHPGSPGSNDWGDSNVRICTWCGLRADRESESFFVFNTHLAVVSQMARVKGVRLILDRIRESASAAPVILCGDFNADESNPCLDPLRRAGFVDTYRALHPTGKAATFNGFSLDYSDEKIDYIWASANVRTLSAEIAYDQIVGRWISDHFPISTIVEI